MAALAAAPDGLTRHELAGRCDMLLSSVCGRVRQLILADRAYESGDTRSTKTGCQAKVVQITQGRK